MASEVEIAKNQVEISNLKNDIQKIDVYDPDAARIGNQQVNNLSYAITSGSLPSGITLDPLFSLTTKWQFFHN